MGSKNPDATVEFEEYTFIFDAKHYSKAPIQSSTIDKIIEYRTQYNALGCALVVLKGTKVTINMENYANENNVMILRRDGVKNNDEEFQANAKKWMEENVAGEEAKSEETKCDELVEVVFEKMNEITELIDINEYWKNDKSTKGKLLQDLLTLHEKYKQFLEDEETPA